MRAAHEHRVATGRRGRAASAGAADPAPAKTAKEIADEAEALRFTLADLAVQRLARATSCADSGYIAGRREWLISEDPDLDGLRAHQRFREFEAMYFPSDDPTPPRPRHVRQLESARYIRDLLSETAVRGRSNSPERSSASR